MYYGWNGGIYEGGQSLGKMGAGFKSGETVKMSVKPKEGKITWSIGGIVEAKYVSEGLQDPSIEWVPFIRMFNCGDSVKWYIEE